MNNTNKSRQFDVAVIGAGHAGVEAALASARIGMKTALFTMSLDSIANMPCNPSIGGTGKGHLVFEIDAMGGEMGYAADAVTMQSRTLNTSKGAAVRSKRVQADRRRYSDLMKKTVEAEENLTVIQSEVMDIITEPDNDGTPRVIGVTTEPLGEFSCRAAIICTGTYLGGTTHVGDVKRASGPDNSLPSTGITPALTSAGITMMRFKTGTPPRIHRRSIDFDALEVQYGEEFITPFSYRTDIDRLNSIEQVPCHVVYTNEITHNIIKSNIHRSPLYSGKIHGTGPRYCPSIEDKVVRFADKERHQLFVEPMGADTDEIYLQGVSSSLPADVQEEMLHSLPGFEHAEVMRSAYAIEYDCIDPLELRATLEFKKIRGLFGAGQFNGTSGYEEAAAQGLLAGMNATLMLRGMPQIILPRHSSYLGTLIDDLVTKGTNEPYRIMTGRSEYRILIRQDNAEERVAEYGHYSGLLSDNKYKEITERTRAVREEVERLRHVNLGPSSGVNALLSERGSTEITSGTTLCDLIRRPGLDYDCTAPYDPARPELEVRLRDRVWTEIKYEGYVKHQLEEVARQQKSEKTRLPADIDYKEIRGLRTEAMQKLERVRPDTIGQASRISGVNPADITVLLIWLQTRGKTEDNTKNEEE
ncbi:MAG: tRNA uridine-5-carboxymethylaminomethyl(34) synthesis enzyme MnmG [Clostridia bacterium]|nr:tRNA uridine-5-carboxymethylaminomethyl(34) synthesis enzyme MnmG [Clostridia bacterium]